MSDTSHAHNSRHGSQTGPQRLKMTPECRLRNPAASKNKDRSNSTTANSSCQPCHSDSIEPIQNVKMKKTCARCKEATKCVKLLSSKMGKLEEIVESLAERCRSDSINNKIPEIFVTNHFGSTNSTFVSLDTFNLFTNLSNCKLEELQNLVIITTNYSIPPMHNSSNYTSF